MRVFTLIVYILIGLGIAFFSAQNFGRVEMWLPFGYEANWPFAVYLIFALILGALPVSIMHSISRWRWKRRVKKLEAELIERGGSPALTERPVTETADPLPSL